MTRRSSVDDGEGRLLGHQRSLTGRFVARSSCGGCMWNAMGVRVVVTVSAELLGPVVEFSCSDRRVCATEADTGDGQDRGQAVIVRVLHDREPGPSMVMVDAQTARGARYGPTFHEPGGRGGRTIGTKRTLLVEILGLPIAAEAGSARPHDVTAPASCCATSCRRWPVSGRSSATAPTGVSPGSPAARA
jgi:hypothetical protein